MATLKYKDVSPYKQPKSKLPVEDYLYAQYEKDIQADVVLNPKKHNVAIFGLGRAGTIHLSTLATSPRVNIMYIVDDITTKHKKVQDYFGLQHTKFLTSKQADQVYKDASVDAVVIATPTYAHEEIVKASLAAKKAVFCEKPVSEDREGTARCYQQAKSMGVPLFCAFNRRFDPSYSMVRDRVHKGEVGHIQTIKVCSRDSPLPTIDYLKTSGGIFHDCAVHDIDMICWVLGEYPCQVSSIATANVEDIKAIDDFDTVGVVMKFPSGSVGMIDLSRNSCYGYDQRLEVFGARGMVRADNEQPMHCITSQTGLDGITSPPIWYSFPSRYRLAYQKEMNHFFDVLEKKCESGVKGFETLAVSKIATAAEESARTGKVIDLKWASDELL